MAFKTTVKTDKAFKNLLGYAYSEEEKNYWEEGIYWTLPLSATDLWLESESIVYDDADATVAAGLAVKYDQYVMTANSSAFYNGKDRAWTIRATPGDEDSELITGFIPHVRYGDDFMFRLYDNDDTLITVPQMISEGIIFDYANGVVVINDDSNYSFNVPFKITVWKYSGLTGEDVGAGGAEQRVYYDSWAQYDDTYPTTEARQQYPNQRYATDVFDNFYKYGSRCKWEFYNLSTGARVDDLTLSGAIDIANYQNANVPNNGLIFTETSVYKPYDIIDESIPVIDKMHGINRLFSAFKGKRAYNHGAPHCGNVSSAFPKGGDIMWTMFDAQFPSYSGYITASDFLTGNGKYGIWLPANERKMYGIPRNKSAVYFPTGLLHFNGRYHFCENWEGPNAMTDTTQSHTYYLSNPKVLGWNGQNNDDGSLTVADLYNTGEGGYVHMPEINITPSRYASNNSLDNNPATSDTVLYGYDFEYRWKQGTRKISRASIVCSIDPGLISVDIRFHYIPIGATNISDYTHFYTYNYTGGGVSQATITATFGRHYQWCDGIYIDYTNLVGEDSTVIHEFDAYEHTGPRALRGSLDRHNVVSAAMSPNMTNLVFFKAMDPEGGLGERYFAVFAKPLGIDTVYVNYIDFTKYDLEAVYFDRDDQKSKFKVISTSDTVRPHARGDEVGIKKIGWLYPYNTPHSYTNAGWHRLPETYLRLRDKTTKKVGPLSRSKIKPIYDQGSIPLGFMIV